MSDRRAAFFALAGLVCLALVPLAEADLRRVPLAVACVYGVLCVASLLDHRSRGRR